MSRQVGLPDQVHSWLSDFPFDHDTPHHIYKKYGRVDDDITYWCIIGSPPCRQNRNHAGAPELCCSFDHEGGDNCHASFITSAPS
eukprot:1292927-Karenia_brevis.AAC.1